MGFNFWEIGFGPCADGVERADQGPAEGGKGVFDHRRDDGIDLARDEAVLLESPQGLGEHLLGDACDLALEFIVAQRPGGQAANYEGGPFIANPREDGAGGAAGIQHAGSGSHPVKDNPTAGPRQALPHATHQK